MAAPRSQKRAPANAGKTTAARRSTSRASTSRTSASRTSRTTAPARTAAHRTPPKRGRSGVARSSRAKRNAGQARLTTLILIATLVAAAWMVYPVFRLQYEHQRQVDSLESELEGLKSRNDELRDEVDELKTPEGVEEVARDTLGLVKPGEQAYVVTGGVAGETLETSATASSASGEPPLWQRALDALFGLQ